MLQKSKDLFKLWNGHVRYCHWKSNEHLMEGLDGETDLDVLLSNADREEGLRILSQVGFVKFHSQLGGRYPNVEDWIGFDSETGRLLHIHLHFALVTGHKGLKEYELPWADEALETCMQDPETGVYIMNPNLELVSLYTRLILKSTKKQWNSAKKNSYSIDKHFFKEIVYIKERVGWDEVSHIADRYYKEYGSAFTSIVKQDTITSQSYLQLYSMVNKVMKVHSRYHGLSLFVRKYIYQKVIKLRKIMRRRFDILYITRKVANPNQGFSVAFIGQDGSGKSTLTGDIQKWLNWKIDAKRFYLGSGDHYQGYMKAIIYRLKKERKECGNNNISSKSNKKGSQGDNVKNLNTLRSNVKLLMSAINLKNVANHANQEVSKSREYIQHGGIALFDRFPQNQFHGIYDGPKISTEGSSGLLKKIIEYFADREMVYINKIVKSQPTIVFKLLLPPEESIRRKPNEKLEAVTRKAEITQKLEFPNSIIYNIDVTQDYNKELLLIKNIIWNYLVEHHS